MITECKTGIKFQKGHNLLLYKSVLNHVENSVYIECLISCFLTGYYYVMVCMLIFICLSAVLEEVLRFSTLLKIVIPQY